MKKVLMLYSGGKDSLLSTLLLLEDAYQVYLVHYDNSFEIGQSNIKMGIKRLIKKYNNKVSFIGINKTDAIFRELIKEIYNAKLNTIIKEYGNISLSQFNCLSCRLSMYIESIIICKRLNINCVADGARISQKFAIEQNEMLNLFIDLFKKYGIELLLPVKDLDDDFKEKNELLARGVIPKANEAQCLLGLPIENNSVDKEMINATVNIYKNLLFPKIDSLIKRYSKTDFGEKYL